MHIIVRFTRVEMKEKMLRAAREKGWVTHKGKPIRLTADLLAETLQARIEWGPIFNLLKEKNFQPEFDITFVSKGNKILYEEAITQRFHHQACFIRAPERSTKQRMEQPVSATPKTYQMVKSINTMKKLHQLMGKTAS